MRIMAARTLVSIFIASAVLLVGCQSRNNNSSPTEQQILDARLAWCVTADRELPDLQAGKVAEDKDPLLLTLQSALGAKAGNIALGQAWGDYRARQWREADCLDLLRASWAPTEGYLGEPIQVPEGAIGAVMRAPGWREQ
jgi:hypothetical protein